MVELINSDPAALDALGTCNESWIYAMTQSPRDRVPTRSMLALPDRGNPPTKF